MKPESRSAPRNPSKRRSLRFPNAVFPGPHPGSAGEAATRCELFRPSLASCLFSTSAQRLLIETFGAWRLPAMAERFGASCQVLGTYAPSGRCLFAMLLSGEAHVRRIWAQRLERLNFDPEPVLAPERVIMDFVAASPQIRGRVMHYICLAFHYLRLCGYSGIASECQELRSLALWLRKGVRALNPPPFDPAQRIRRISAERRLSGRTTGLLDGESLLAADDSWQLFLKEPVYFTIDFGDEQAFERFTRSVLGTAKTGVRLASADSWAPNALPVGRPGRAHAS